MRRENFIKKWLFGQDKFNAEKKADMKKDINNMIDYYSGKNNALRSDEDELILFWRTIQEGFRHGRIQTGYHIRVKEENELFSDNVEVKSTVFIYFNELYSYYKKALTYRAAEKSKIRSLIEQHRSFIESKRSVRFLKMQTDTTRNIYGSYSGININYNLLKEDFGVWFSFSEV